METNRQKNSPLVFYILGFMAAVFFELYWIGNFPFDYFMIIGIGLVMMIMGYLTFDGILKAYNEAQEIKREQNEIMIKAQKAIYLATKKNSAEAENMQIQNLKAVNLLMDRMVDTITEKQIEMNDKSKAAAPVDLTGLIAELTESNAKLAKELQNAVTVNQLVKANEDLIRNVKDVLSGKTPDIPDTTYRPQDMEQKPVSHGTDHVTSAENDMTIYNIPNNTYDSNPYVSPVYSSNDTLTSTTYYGNGNDIPMNTTPYVSGDDMSIDDISVDEPNEINQMEDDIALAEAAVANASQTIEAMEAASELDADISAQEDTVNDEMESDSSLEAAASSLDNDPNAMLTPEEIAKLFAGI